MPDDLDGLTLILEQHVGDLVELLARRGAKVGLSGLKHNLAAQGDDGLLGAGVDLGDFGEAIHRVGQAFLGLGARLFLGVELFGLLGELHLLGFNRFVLLAKLGLAELAGLAGGFELGGLVGELLLLRIQGVLLLF